MSRAIITGATGGIGTAISKKLASKFAIAAVGRNELRGRNLITELKAISSFPHKFYQCDMTKPDAVTKFVVDLKSNRDKVDVLVNCAGISIDRLLPRLQHADISQQFNTNVISSIYLTSLVVKEFMLRQNSGVIVSIGSVVGRDGNSGQSVYAATKSALTGFNKSIAKELGPRGIRSVVVSPGFIATDMTKNLHVMEDLKSRIPQRRVGTADEVASVVEFVVSSNASYVNGSEIFVTGGLVL